MTVKINVMGGWQEATPFVNVGGTWKEATAWIKVNGTWVKTKKEIIPPRVTQSPASVTSAIGLSHTFTANFSGTDLQFQWYEDGVAISGANEKTYSLVPAASKNGKQYYCVATNEAGSAQTNSATLTLRRRIYFNSTIWSAFDSSDTVKLVFKNDGFIDVITSERTFSNFDTWISGGAIEDLPAFNISEYKARVSRLSAGITIVSGSIGETLTTLTNGSYIEVNITGLSIGQSSFFDIEFEDTVLPDYNWAGWDNGNVFVRRLTPPKPPRFTSNPSSRSVTEGDRVSFSAVATGDTPISYQWEYQNSGSSFWSTWSGQTSTTLSFTTTLSNNGRKVRCKATNAAGSVYSSIATLTVEAKPKAPSFTRNPSNQTVSSGSKATFTVSATGDSPISYQWEYRNSGSSFWSTWSGKTSTTLSFTTSASNNGRKVRCKATNPVGSTYSSIATLTVN